MPGVDGLCRSTAIASDKLQPVLSKVAISQTLRKPDLFNCAEHRSATLNQSDNLLILLVNQTPLKPSTVKPLALAPCPRLNLRDAQLLQDHWHRTRIMQIRLHKPLTQLLIT
ncbi:hypothetical protein HMPREF3147_03090 [Corynebacterium sp. HMSC05D03]|nr:hypothetical protein HMPREF2781_07355 [Corynebacterium sp. HMSC062A03]OFP22539.1 hypothetical protein HMPREF2996_11695 [Corynebacterium sp. HMSC066C02]OFQ36791.1 hypothetical protein HMPREF2943_00385 [Corynebacterium sp. HMSC072D12]OFT66870.1 hypothetical protein HMPREF3147_03090 [Corynebacterium sp. HMSC05D03]